MATADVTEPVADEPLDATTIPADSTPAEPTEPAAPPPAEPDAEYSVRQWFKETIADDPEVDKFKNDTEFLRSLYNAHKKIGERNADTATMRWLQDQGITPQDLASLVESRKSPAAPAAPKGEEWDDSWVTTDAEGKVIPTAAGRAALGDQIGPRYLAHQQRSLARMSKIDDIVAEKVKALAPQLAEQAAQQARQQAAQWQEQQALEGFARDNEAVLFLGGKELRPEIPIHTRLQKALKQAVAESAPVPAAKPVPKGATHAATPATPSQRRLSYEQFFKKYPTLATGNISTAMDAWAKYNEEGKLPEL
jgi:hypothetical protein